MFDNSEEFANLNLGSGEKIMVAALLSTASPIQIARITSFLMQIQLSGIVNMLQQRKDVEQLRRDAKEGKRPVSDLCSMLREVLGESQLPENPGDWPDVKAD